jgi:hypothetical protein
MPFVAFNKEDAETYFDQWIQYMREQQKNCPYSALLSQVIMCKERDFNKPGLPEAQKTGTQRGCIKTF